MVLNSRHFSTYAYYIGLKILVCVYMKVERVEEAWAQIQSVLISQVDNLVMPALNFMQQVYQYER